MKKRLLAIILVFVFLFSIVGCGENQNDSNLDSEVNGLEGLELIVGVAPGPVTYPLAFMAENNANIDLRLWQGGEQLTSMITTKEVQLCSTPINNAILTYNKGMDVELLMVTVWGMLYVISVDKDLTSLEDLKGKEIAVSGQGGIHDHIFRHLLIEKGINPDTDLIITYMDMPEASSRLVTGDLNYAILNEPHSSIVTLNAKKAGVTLHRALDLTKEWAKLPGQENVRFPMAGIVIVKDDFTTNQEYMSFVEEYFKASEWVNNNPNEIGPIVERYVPWMKAAAVTESIKYARLEPQMAKECQTEIEAFFNELSKNVDAKAFGGKLPDAAFYYQGK